MTLRQTHPAYHQFAVASEVDREHFRSLQAWNMRNGDQLATLRRSASIAKVNVTSPRTRFSEAHCAPGLIIMLPSQLIAAPDRSASPQISFWHGCQRQLDIDATVYRMRGEALNSPRR